MSGTLGRAALPQPPTKTVVVYRNGDAFFPGRKFVINQRHMSTFDSFLSSVTSGVEAPFGAVRNVYTPREGHKVFDLEHLRHGERYVAGGAERFKKLDYCQITTKKSQKKKREQIIPVVHSRIVVPARWRKIINESCTINVFTNGDVLVPPSRILLPKYTLTNWECVMAMVTEKVHLRTGAVQRLCTLDGSPLRGPAQLENNQYYVAVGAERFRALPYYQWVPRKGHYRMANGLSHEYLPTVGKTKQQMHRLSQAVFCEDFEQRGARGQMQNPTDSSFYANPERAKQQKPESKIPLLVSTGDGSVFRAKHKRRELLGASEVQEDRGVKVDLPIDQVKAKVVEEEPYEQRYSRPSSRPQTPNRGSDNASPQRPLSSASPRTPPSSSGEGQAESGRGTGLTGGSPAERGRRSQPPEGPQETKEETATSSKTCRLRSRMCKFFKGEKSKN